MVTQLTWVAIVGLTLLGIFLNICYKFSKECGHGHVRPFEFSRKDIYNEWSNEDWEDEL